MRILKIGGVVMDIDKDTAIGVDYQSYDLKEPAQPKINITNTFSLPATNKNRAVFGFVDDPQSLTNIPYGELFCDYWVSNRHLIKNARVRLENIEDRIGLFIYQKLSIWDELKKLDWSSFATEILTWLQDFKGYASDLSPDTGDIIANSGIIDNTEGLFLPFYLGNLEKEDVLPLNSINLGDETQNGGHICVYYKTIFEFLEYKYSVNFGTSGSIYNSNIWDDAIAPLLYIPVRDIAVKLDNPAYFYISDAPFLPYSPELKDKGDKNIHDIVLAFFQHFNMLIDYLEVDYVDYIALRRFDDIKENAEVVSLSGKLDADSRPKFSYSVDGYGQSNYIRFKTVFDEKNKNANQKILTSFNLNLDVNADLLEIDAYAHGVVENENNEFIANLTTEDAIKEASFLISGAKTVSDINISSIAFPPSIDPISFFIDPPLVGFTTFSSTNNGADNIGTSSVGGEYAETATKTAEVDNYLDLSWIRTGSFLGFSLQVYDITNSIEAYSVDLFDEILQYTFVGNIDYKLRIINKTAGNSSFSFTDLAGLLYDYKPSETNAKLHIANLYNLDSEYNFLDEIITKPRLYDVEMWLTVNDIQNLEYFKQYHVKELNGSYFINKISGFNPEASKSPTTLSLIKISDKTPPPNSDTDFWRDGVDVIFTDGEGANWF